MKSPIPIFANSLRAMSGFLKIAETHCETNGIDPDVLLNARLFPDMLPLIAQVRIASDTAKGSAARLTATDIPSFEDNEKTFADLQGRISKTLDYLASVDEAGFEGAETREVILKTRTSEHRFDGQGYLVGFGLPNFYFHVATAYNILRHNGVSLGKMDFLGAR